jgi:hypothetical protein
MNKSKYFGQIILLGIAVFMTLIAVGMSLYWGKLTLSDGYIVVDKRGSDFPDVRPEPAAPMAQKAGFTTDKEQAAKTLDKLK